jgi:hypothetical protein
MIKEVYEFEVELERIKSVCFPCWISKNNGNMNDGGVEVLTTSVTKITLLGQVFSCLHFHS